MRQRARAGAFVRARPTVIRQENRDQLREFAFSRLLCARAAAVERQSARRRGRHTCTHRPGARRLLKGAARGLAFSCLHQDALHTPQTPLGHLPGLGPLRFIRPRFDWMYPYASLQEPGL